MIKLSTIADPIAGKILRVLQEIENGNIAGAEIYAKELTGTKAQMHKLLKILGQVYLYCLSREKDGCAEKMVQLNQIFEDMKL